MRNRACLIVLSFALHTGCAQTNTRSDAGFDSGASRADAAARDSQVHEDVTSVVDAATTDASPIDAGGARRDAGPYTSCTHPTECRLIPESCCGNCGAYGHGDIQSVHVADVDAARAVACTDGAFCPACTMPDPPDFVATCEEGRCGYVALYDPVRDHRSEFTECVDDDDCVLRTTECCECGARPSFDSLVSIRVDRRGDYQNLVCPPDFGCPECGADYEPFFARCGSDTPEMPRRCLVDVVGP